METATFNFRGEHAIKRGTTRNIPLTFQNSSDGTPITNIASAIAKVSTAPGAIALTQFNADISSISQGTIILSLAVSQTLALARGVYFWELFVTMTNGDTFSPLQGAIEFTDKIQ